MKYCPAPVFTSSAFLASRPSYASPLTSASSDIQFSASIRSTIRRRSLAGSWILFCAFRKMTPSMPGLLAELFEDVAVVGFELVAVAARLATASPDPSGTIGRPIERRLRLLVRHLQEEQEGELLDVVAVGEAVVAEDVAVVPELLDDLVGGIAHAVTSWGTVRARRVPVALS